MLKCLSTLLTVSYTSEIYFLLFIGQIFLLHCRLCYFCLNMGVLRFLHWFLSRTCSNLLSMEIYLFNHLSGLISLFLYWTNFVVCYRSLTSQYQGASFILVRSPHQPACILSVYLITWVFSNIPILWLAVFQIFLRCTFSFGTV